MDGVSIKAMKNLAWYSILNFKLLTKWSLCTMQVLQSMVQMGVLVPTGDMTAVKRTAQFFLNR